MEMWDLKKTTKFCTYFIVLQSGVTLRRLSHTDLLQEFCTMSHHSPQQSTLETIFTCYGGKAQVLLTLTVALSHSTVPLTHDSPTGSQHEQYQDSEAVKWHSASKYIIYTSAFSTVTCQNISQANVLLHFIFNEYFLVHNLKRNSPSWIHLSTYMSDIERPLTFRFHWIRYTQCTLIQLNTKSLQLFLYCNVIFCYNVLQNCWFYLIMVL